MEPIQAKKGRLTSTEKKARTPEPLVEGSSRVVTKVLIGFSHITSTDISGINMVRTFQDGLEQIKRNKPSLVIADVHDATGDFHLEIDRYMQLMQIAKEANPRSIVVVYTSDNCGELLDELIRIGVPPNRVVYHSEPGIFLAECSGIRDWMHWEPGMPEPKEEEPMHAVRTTDRTQTREEIMKAIEMERREAKREEMYRLSRRFLNPPKEYEEVPPRYYTNTYGNPFVDCVLPPRRK